MLGKTTWSRLDLMTDVSTAIHRTEGLESEEGVSENTKQNRSQRRISELRASAMLYKMKQESCE